MTEEKFEWMVSGDCVEGCTSPPVCPAIWNSPLQSQLHQGRSECEGVWTFNIRQGYYDDIDLGALVVLYAFNSPSPFPSSERSPWKCIIFIDEKADARQVEALEKIFRTCWSTMGDVITVKRVKIEFNKELIDDGPTARYKVQSEGLYNFTARPLRTRDRRPRYVNSYLGGHINVGISEVNEFNDPDLPRGKWNAPGMSVTYYDFILNPKKLNWFPD
jgi:hypothetical protein